MKYYMDLEFNSPTNELLSIGCVNERNEEFHTYVNPGHRRVEPYISRITGITNGTVKNAPDPENAFILLYNYMKEINEDDEFYFYGPSDKEVLKLTLYKMPKKDVLNFLGEHIIKHYIDATEKVKKHFNIIQSVSLQKVVNFYNNSTDIQSHDALDDSKMLKYIIYQIDDDNKYNVNRTDCFPEYKTNQNIAHKIRRLDIRTGEPLEEYDSVSEASNWLINNYLKNTVKNTKLIKKHNINKKISTSYKTHTSYVGFDWEVVE